MKWLEFIKVQTSNRDAAEILLKLVGECKKCHGLLEAKLLNHSSLHDCSLCLFWNTKAAEFSGSKIGVRISNTLKKFGLVDHSVWVEVNDREEGHYEIDHKTA